MARVAVGRHGGAWSPSATGGPAPDVVAPPPHHRRFPLFDGLRAVAVLSVVVFHVTLLSGALSTSIGGHLLAHLNIGVTIFFLISGFLLYRPFIAHRVGGAAPPQLLEYAKRRVLRIYPAYWVILTVLLIVPGVGGFGHSSLWAEYGLVQTLPVHSGAGCVGDCGLAQTWSLVAEVTFYAVLPLYVLLAARVGRGRSVLGWMRAELLLLTALSAISIALRFLLIDQGSPWVDGTLIGYVFWFALGMGLAVASVGLEERERQPRILSVVVSRPLIPWLAALTAYVLMSLWLPVLLATEAQRFIALLALGAISALVLLPAVFGDDAGGVPRRVLAHPVLAWLGVVSYGIFLWHFVFAQQLGRGGYDGGFVVVLLGTLALSTACAAASYYLVERPILRFKHRRLPALIRVPRPRRAGSVAAPDVSQSGRL